MGDVVGRVFLTVFHFTLFVPFALVVRLTSDPLQLHMTNKASYWMARETRERMLEDSHRLA